MFEKGRPFKKKCGRRLDESSVCQIQSRPIYFLLPVELLLFLFSLPSSVTTKKMLTVMEN